MMIVTDGESVSTKSDDAVHDDVGTVNGNDLGVLDMANYVFSIFVVSVFIDPASDKDSSMIGTINVCDATIIEEL